METWLMKGMVEVLNQTMGSVLLAVLTSSRPGGRRAFWKLPVRQAQLAGFARLPALLDSAGGSALQGVEGPQGAPPRKS